MLQDQTATKTFREATHRYDQDATCREAWGIHKVSWRCSVCRLPTQHRFQVMELPAWGNSEISSCFMWVENLKELRLVWSQVWEVDSCYCSKACCPCWIRVLTKHSDQPGAKYSRQQEDMPTSTGRSSLTTSTLQQQQAASEARTRASR